MVEPVTAGTGIVLTSGALYFGLRAWRRRNQRLRALALAEKYSTSTRLKSVGGGGMSLVVNMPQLAQVPTREQEAWKVRDQHRDRNHMELGLIQPEVPELELDANEEQERISEVGRRDEWIQANESPLVEHAALVSEEHIGSGVVVAEESDEHEVDIDERLEREGGESGVVQISLAWDDYNDLDLHVFTPSGERIYFNNKISDCDGILDVDMNVRPVSNTPVENVVWKESAPLGTYKVGVHFYKHHRRRRTKKKCKFRLRVITHGKTKEYIGRMKYGQAMQMVTSFTLSELSKEY
ncbi:MAG: hypothetical protein CMA65_02240 [Euryarchaeota archaeon]|nr:hypothetical protein [Euryarchaeota archaeon]